MKVRKRAVFDGSVHAEKKQDFVGMSDQGTWSLLFDLDPSIKLGRFAGCFRQDWQDTPGFFYGPIFLSGETDSLQHVSASVLKKEGFVWGSSFLHSFPLTP
jgi:hypothetical protein